MTGGEGDTLLNKENVALSNNAGRGSFLSPLPPSAKHGLPLSDFPDSVSAKKPRLFGSATDLTSEPSALDHLLGCLSSEYSIPSSAMRHPSARLLMNPLLGDSSKRHSDSPLTSRSRFVNGQLMGLEGEEDEDEDFGGSMDLFSKALAEFKVNTAHKNTHDYSRLPATCNSFLQGKTSRGGALYFPKRSSSVLLSNKDESVPTKSISKKGLLKKSIFVMLSEVEKKVDATASVSRTPASSIALPKTSAETPSTIKGSLWVDKYRPKMYIDLVGDEVFYILIIFGQLFLKNNGRKQTAPFSLGSNTGTTALLTRTLRERIPIKSIILMGRIVIGSKRTTPRLRKRYLLIFNAMWLW